MAHLLIFIHNGGINKKVLYSPDFKMVLIFLVTKLFQKGTMFNWVTVQLSHEILSHAMVSKMPDGLSVQPPPPPGKLAAHGQLKLPFGDSCLSRFHYM